MSAKDIRSKKLKKNLDENCLNFPPKIMWPESQGACTQEFERQWCAGTAPNFGAGWHSGISWAVDQAEFKNRCMLFAAGPEFFKAIKNHIEAFGALSAADKKHYPKEMLGSLDEMVELFKRYYDKS